MADTKISALTELAVDEVAANDWIPVADSSVSTTKKADLSEVIHGTLNTVAASGATETLTLDVFQKVTMDQNCTFTFPTPVNSCHTFVLHLIGAFTPTWPASVDWPSATEPTYATPTIYVFHTNDGGTTWFGALFGGAGGFG